MQDEPAGPGLLGSRGDAARLEVPGRSLGVPAGLAAIGLVILGALAVAGWVVLHGWYSLFANASNTHFAFEKVPGHFASPILRGTLLLFLGLSLVYLAGYWLLEGARAMTVAVKLGAIFLAVGPAVVNVLLYPVGALDVFNYMIELKLAYHYDQNPYVVTFAAFRADPFALPAFLVDVPLFYGPAWLLFSWLPTAIAGVDDVVRLLLALKVFNALLLVLAAMAISAYQRDRRRGWLAGYAFLANPLVLFEGLANGHNDVMVALFVVVALLALKRGSPLAVPLLTVSALVKFFTAALGPVFLAAMLWGKAGGRRIVVSGVLSLAVAVAAAAPFWADGALIDGLIRGTKMSQEMDHVSVLSLTQQYAREREEATRSSFAWRFVPQPEASPQPSPAGFRPPGFALAQRTPPQRTIIEDLRPFIRRGFAGLFAVLALGIAWTVWRGRAVEAAVVDTSLLFALLLTNLYPWYLIPVIAVLALKRDALGSVYLFGATALALAYYPMYVWAHFDTGWPKLKVHLFLALFLTVPMIAYLAAELGRAGFAGSRVVLARALRSRAEASSQASKPLQGRGRLGWPQPDHERRP